MIPVCKMYPPRSTRVLKLCSHGPRCPLTSLATVPGWVPEAEGNNREVGGSFQNAMPSKKSELCKGRREGNRMASFP